jgi:hypothetical protein
MTVQEDALLVQQTVDRAQQQERVVVISAFLAIL